MCYYHSEGDLQLKPVPTGLNLLVLLLFQLQLPSSALLEGSMHWTPPDSPALDYWARGRLRVERQESQVRTTHPEHVGNKWGGRWANKCVLDVIVIFQFSLHLNGTTKVIGLYSSLSHPFKSKIPKTVEVGDSGLFMLSLFVCLLK